MVEPIYWSALLLGLGGSLHCVGMCGPLALALSAGRGRTARFLVSRLLYNGGRTVTYTALGLVFGLVGGVVDFAGWQRGLSVILGALIIAGAVGDLLQHRLEFDRWIGGAGAWLKQPMGRLMRLDNPGSLFLVGILNGLLPCSFVLLALAASLAAGGPVQGMAFMALYGAGTIPLMLATSCAGRVLRPNLQGTIRRILPVGMAALGALLVLRGLGLVAGHTH